MHLVGESDGIVVAVDAELLDIRPVLGIDPVCVRVMAVSYPPLTLPTIYSV